MSKIILLSAIVLSSIAANACDEQLTAMLKQKANAYCFENGPQKMLLSVYANTGTKENEKTKMFLMECTFGGVIGVMTYNTKTCEVVSISESDTKVVENN